MERAFQAKWVSAVCRLMVAGLLASAPALAQSNTVAPKKASARATKSAAKSSSAPLDMSTLKSLGSKSAPITMEVFSDFQCPSCRQLFVEAIQPLIDNYVAAGKVYLIHRDMPLQSHPHSREAARYANAAARLRKFWVVEAVLYNNEDKWAAGGNVEAVVDMVLNAAEMKQVRQWVRSSEIDAAINKDAALGGQLRVTQTPTSFITYKGQSYPVVGAMSYSILKTFLEQLLRQ